MWTVLIIIFFWVLFIGLAIFLIVYNKRKERERTQALQQAAATLRWNFAAEAPLTQIPWLERFTLFSQGHNKRIRNFMYGEAQGVKAAVFDYIYVTGSGKNQQTHFQTVVYLERPNLMLPMFALRPETIFHRMISALGYQDIDFGQRPDFSKQYLLRGQDEPRDPASLQRSPARIFRKLPRHLPGRRRRSTFHLSRQLPLTAARN
jgi:hypothetical protein